MPEALNNPLEVRELKLSSKDIQYLPRFQNLEALVLNVDGKHLPVEIFEAVGLKSLVIAAYEGAEIPADRFAVFQKLEYLSFEGSYKFTVTGKGFPHTMFELKKLRRFNVQISSLKDLPRDAFLRFENLEELQIAYQKADQQILENIFACKTLKKLSLDLRNSSKNAFLSDSLLASVGQLRQLTKLSIGGHKLTRLPDSFNQLTELEELELDRNAFVDLPFQAENFKKLRRLNLGYNKIETIPHGLLYIDSLQELDWYSNPISKHPIFKKGQPIADFIKKISGFEPLTRASAWKVFTTDETDLLSIGTPELVRALAVDLQTFQRKTHALLNGRIRNPFVATTKPEETTLLLLGRNHRSLPATRHRRPFEVVSGRVGKPVFETSRQLNGRQSDASVEFQRRRQRKAGSADDGKRRHTGQHPVPRVPDMFSQGVGCVQSGPGLAPYV